MSILEKYALPYYVPVLHHLISVSILLYTNDVKLFNAYMLFVITCAYYIPYEDTENTKYSQYINTTKWALIPLILNCLSTPTVLYVCWENYDQLTSTTSDWIGSLFGVGMLLSGSIDASH